MNCRESRSMIPAWLDQELPGRDGEALEAHLDACEDCSAFARREQGFVRGLRENLPREAAPPELKERLLSSVRAPAVSTAPARRWALGAAAGLALAGLLLALFVPRAGLSEDWTRFYLQEHQAHSGAEAADFNASDPAKVAGWLGSALGHPVHVPSMPDAELLGGRLCRLRGQKVGLALYRSKGRMLSLFMGDPKLLCPQGLKRAEGELYAQSGPTLSLVAWQHNGHFHVAVSELDLAELSVLAKQCQASL